MTRIMIVAAHPDDESIGASALLAKSEITLIHATDGAARDPRWWSPRAPATRAAYARMRREEAERALALAGVSTARAFEIGIPDQDAVHELPALAIALAHYFEELAPEVVVTHAYEGGHPDHDAVACAVALACARIPHAPRVFEMALYHGATGVLCAGEHLPDAVAAVYELTLAEQRRRIAMLECFASQRETLAPFFGITHEALRPAPSYDFSQPPHAGELLYERFGMSTSGVEWRELAARAQEQLTR
jgi:LmbE family N-acetylglucosaminyl deacetylase